VTAAPSYGPVVCWKCDRGRRYVPDVDPFKPGRWMPCGTCGGTGTTTGFLYPKPKRARRGR
jgi:hypothetical protein